MANLLVRMICDILFTRHNGGRSRMRTTNSGAGNRLFRRLLVFNLVTVVVITIVPQFVFSSYSVSVYEKEINGLNMQTVRQFQSAIDEPVLKDMINFPNVYLSELESNEALTFPFSHDIRNNSTAIVRVSRRIDDIKNNLPYVHSIDLYYRHSKLLFLDNHVCMLDESDCSRGFSRDWFDEFRDSDINIKWIPARSSGSTGPNVISYVRSIPYFGNKENRQGAIAINIDVAVLGRLLQKLKPSSEGWLLIVDEQGRLVASNQGDATDGEYENKPFVRKLFSMGATGMFTDDIDGLTNVVSFAKSDYNNWRYVSVTSAENFYKNSSSYRGWLLAVGGAFLTLNLLITVLLTKQSHKPISYRMRSLQHRLERHQPIVRHNMIMSLLKGSAQTDVSIQETGPLYAYICCFVLHMYRKPNMSLDEETSVAYQVVEMLEARNPIANVWAIKDDGFQLFGIVNIAEEASLPEMIKHMTICIEGVVQDRYVLCMGEKYSVGQPEIARSFAEAKECLLYAYLRPEAKVILYRDLRIDERKDTGNAVNMLYDVESYIRLGDEKRLQGLIANVLAEIQSGEYTIQYCRNVTTDVVTTIHKAVSGMGYSPNEIVGTDIREYGKQIETIHEFHSWILHVIHAVTDKINERRNHVDKEFANRIVQFIDDNICNQLSLDMVAEYANVSPTHLSKIFKVITGSNFSDYVTDLKLAQATALLEQEQLSVQEISKRIGYNSTHYFIRLFKKKYGHTPKQYQKERRSAQQDREGKE